MRWALGSEEAPPLYWEHDNRVYDPFRPVVEFNGFESVDEMLRSRTGTINAFGQSIANAKFMVFTLGLTEHWMDAVNGLEFPMCPGTAAGRFDAERHVFRNHTYETASQSLQAAIDLARSINPDLNIILTVSPVPMTATYSAQHVVVATMHTKSILRAVAGEFAATNSYIDYFPGYEFVNSPAFKGVFFQPNQRNVTKHGITLVMDLFEACFEHSAQPTKPYQAHDDARCEEELLSAFRKHR